MNDTVNDANAHARDCLSGGDAHLAAIRAAQVYVPPRREPREEVKTSWLPVCFFSLMIALGLFGLVHHESSQHCKVRASNPSILARR